LYSSYSNNAMMGTENCKEFVYSQNKTHKHNNYFMENLIDNMFLLENHYFLCLNACWCYS